MEKLTKIAEELPITAKYDVLILGGGPAGISAAVSSAKTGAKTAIVERYGYLGGQATGGLVILLVGLTDGNERIIKGFCEDTINRIDTLGAIKNIGRHVLFDPESMKFIFDCMIQENHIKPYYHSFASDVIIENGKVSGVIIDGKSGRQIIKSKFFVDATGDGDLAKFCDVPFSQEENKMLVTLGFRVGGINTEKVGTFIRNNNSFYKELLQNIGISTQMGGWLPTLHTNEAWFNISHIENVDITNSDSLTNAEILGRRQIQEIITTFKEHIEGFENGYLIDTASQIGGRASRQIDGLHKFTVGDVTKSFEDVIAKAPDYTGSGKGSVEIPYRCLVTKEFNNVIFAGRCISVDHKLIDMFREIPCCMATGQAAGVACGVASLTSCDLRSVDIKEVQKTLVEQGVFLPEKEFVKVN